MPPTIPRLNTLSPVSGRAAWGCDCLARWWPVFLELAQLKDLRPVISQGCMWSYVPGSGATASAGTHNGGGVLDLTINNAALILLARSMGAAAFARHTPTFDSEHTHLVLIGCPHNGPAAYQVDALLAGWDGLGYQGRGSRDTGPRPPVWRTWSEGISWARAEIDHDTTTKGLPDMTEDQMDKLAAKIAKAIWTGTTYGVRDGSRMTVGQLLVAACRKLIGV